MKRRDSRERYSARIERDSKGKPTRLIWEPPGPRLGARCGRVEGGSMRLWIVEVRARSGAGAWHRWVPASTVAFWERGQAWALARRLRHTAPPWKQYRVKPWIRERAPAQKGVKGG